MQIEISLLLALTLGVTLFPGVNGRADITDNRRHWDSDDGVILSGKGEQWAEKLEPGASDFAVFSHEPPRELSLQLDGDRTWRGVVVDGELLSLDLAGYTLNLASNGDATNDFNIGVGGMFYRDSTLVLSNGLVKAALPFSIGHVPRGLNPVNASLRLGAGAEVETPAVVVGGPDRVEAELYVENGATLVTDRLELGVGRGSEADVSIQGPGTKLVVSGQTSVIGGEGNVEFYLHSGATADWGNALVTLDAGRAGHTLIYVKDPGTVSTGGNFRIGYFAGLSVDYDAVFNPASVAVSAGAFHVGRAEATLDRLELNEGNVTFNSGARATITNAILTNAMFRVDGEGTVVRILNPLVVSNSVLEIDHASVLELNGVHIAPGGKLRGNFGTLKSATSVISDGSVFPGNVFGPLGFLTIDGDFEQTSNGVLEFWISGTNQNRLTVQGNAVINGRVKVRFDYGGAPKAGETITLVIADAPLTGAPIFEFQGVEPGWEYEAGFDGNNLIIRSLNDARPIRNLSGPSDYGINVSLPDTDPATFALLELPAHGTISGEYPELFYTSEPDFVGFDYIRYRNSDGLETTLQFTIEPVVRRPQITQEGAEILTVQEGSEVRRNGTFTDPPGNGAVRLYAPIGEISQDNETGTWSWVYQTTNGPDESIEFAIIAEDEYAAEFAYTRLVVQNVAPITRRVTFLRFIDEPIAIELTATDPGNDAITYEIVTPPSHGVLSGTPPLLTYAPDIHYTGSDSFTFKAIDSDGAESVVTAVHIADLREGAEPISLVKDGGNWVITFQGLPGGRYRIQAAASLEAPVEWVEIGSSPVNPDGGIDSGRFIFTDTEAVTGQRFYRAVPE